MSVAIAPWVSIASNSASFSMLSRSVPSRYHSAVSTASASVGAVMIPKRP